MVSLLKKFLLTALVTLYAASSAWASIEVNDSGTWRSITEIYVNDSGTWRAIEQVSINDSGTWRTSYHAVITTITVGTDSDFYGYAHPNYSPVTGSSISDATMDMPGVGTIVAILDYNTLNQLQLVLCTSTALTQTSFSRIIIYTTAGGGSLSLPTSTASSFTSDLNVVGNCSTMTGTGSFDVYNWRWNLGVEHWNADDLGETRKVVLIR